MTDHQALAHVRAAEDLWIERSARVWTLDLAILTDAGVTVRPPETAAARAAAADQALQKADPGPPVRRQNPPI